MTDVIETDEQWIARHMAMTAPLESHIVDLLPSAAALPARQLGKSRRQWDREFQAGFEALSLRVVGGLARLFETIWEEVLGGVKAVIRSIGLATFLLLYASLLLALWFLGYTLGR